MATFSAACSQDDPKFQATGTDAVGEEMFFPPSRLEGNKGVIDLTLPDGRSFEVTYPVDAGLDEFSVQTYVPGGINDPMRDASSVVVSYYDFYDHFAGSGRPLATYEREDGSRVELWPGPKDSPADQYLVYQFGGWTVAVADQENYEMSDEQRLVWAENLFGEETDNGYLVLRATPPLTLATRTEDPYASLILQEGNNRVVTFISAECEPYRAGERGLEEEDLREINGMSILYDKTLADWCDPEAQLVIHVKGPSTFVESLAGQLVVSRK